jgi:hypothetical protein
MHQAAIRSLWLVEDRLRKHSPEKKATYHKDKGKETSSTNPRKAKQASHQAVNSIGHEGRMQEIS